MQKEVISYTYQIILLIFKLHPSNYEKDFVKI